MKANCLQTHTHTYIPGYTIRFIFSDFSNTFKKDDSYVGYCSGVLEVHRDLFTFLFELQAWDLKFTAVFSWINEK